MVSTRPASSMQPHPVGPAGVLSAALASNVVDRLGYTPNR